MSAGFAAEPGELFGLVPLAVVAHEIPVRAVVLRQLAPQAQRSLELLLVKPRTREEVGEVRRGEDQIAGVGKTQHLGRGRDQYAGSDASPQSQCRRRLAAT